MTDTPLLTNYVKQFEYYRSLGEKAMAQITDADLLWRSNPESNSIAVIVKHLSGNMLSRWTDFLTSDGEKEWRQRDAEFEIDNASRDDVMKMWNKGWDCLLDTLKSLSDDELSATILIRNQEHSVREAINRQLAHYPYHIGQLVMLAKMRSAENWSALSIAKNASKEFNKAKFDADKQGGHYTDEWTGKK